MCPKGKGFQVENSVRRSVVISFPSISLLVAGASDAKSNRYLQPMMWGEETLQCLATSALNNIFLTCAWHRGLSVDHQPTWRYSSPWELTVSRTKPPAFGCSLGLKRREHGCKHVHLHSFIPARHKPLRPCIVVKIIFFILKPPSKVSFLFKPIYLIM